MAHRNLKAPTKLRPFRIIEGCFGENRPDRDLLLSRQHCILQSAADLEEAGYLGDVLVPIHTQSVATDIEMVTPPFGIFYHHVLLAYHHLTWANGFLCEMLLVAPQSIKAMTGLKAIVNENPALGDMHPLRPILDNKSARTLAQRVFDITRRVGQPPLPAQPNINMLRLEMSGAQIT